MRDPGNEVDCQPVAVEKLACSTGGLAGSSVVLVRAREARGEKNPPDFSRLVLRARAPVPR